MACADPDRGLSKSGLGPGPGRCWGRGPRRTGRCDWHGARTPRTWRGVQAARARKRRIAGVRRPDRGDPVDRAAPLPESLTPWQARLIRNHPDPMNAEADGYSSSVIPPAPTPQALACLTRRRGWPRHHRAATQRLPPLLGSRRPAVLSLQAGTCSLHCRASREPFRTTPPKPGSVAQHRGTAPLPTRGVVVAVHRVLPVAPHTQRLASWCARPLREPRPLRCQSSRGWSAPRTPYHSPRSPCCRDLARSPAAQWISAFSPGLTGPIPPVKVGGRGKRSSDRLPRRLFQGLLSPLAGDSYCLGTPIAWEHPEP
jgi:hypothetical protein